MVTKPITKIVPQYQTNPIQSVAPNIPAIDPLKIDKLVNVFELIWKLCETDSPFTNKYFSSFSSSDFLFKVCCCRARAEFVVAVVVVAADISEFRKGRAKAAVPWDLFIASLLFLSLSLSSARFCTLSNFGFVRFFSTASPVFGDKI